MIRVTGPPYNSVKELLVNKAQTQVMTVEGLSNDGIWAQYDISEALVPQSVFFSDHYRFEHERLSAEGKIKHSLSACPERLKPIVVPEWSPVEGWKYIPLPPIEPGTSK